MSSEREKQERWSESRRMEMRIVQPRLYERKDVYSCVMTWSTRGATQDVLLAYTYLNAPENRSMFAY